MYAEQRTVQFANAYALHCLNEHADLPPVPGIGQHNKLPGVKAADLSLYRRQIF